MFQKIKIPRSFSLRTLLIAIAICAVSLVILASQRHDSTFVLGEKAEWKIIETKNIPTYAQLRQQGFRNVFEGVELNLPGAKSTRGVSMVDLLQRRYRTISESGHFFALHLEISQEYNTNNRTVSSFCGGGANSSPYAMMRTKVDHQNSIVDFQFYEVFPHQLKEIKVTLKIHEDGRVERVEDP